VGRRCFVRGREDDARFVIEPLEHLQASRTRHHDVEQYQLRALSVGQRDRRLPVGRFMDHSATTQFAELRPQRLPRRRFVIGDEDRLVHDGRPAAATTSATGAGTKKLAWKPSRPRSM
jgi:hypothetical protein